MSFLKIHQQVSEVSDSSPNNDGSTNDQELTGGKSNNVVYEHNGNTITVQSTKVIGEYNYSFVSVSPTKKAMIDTPMLKKIKIIQINELKTWKGMQVDYISRPGKRKLEDERFKLFIEGLLRYREWEEERLNSVYQLQDPSLKNKDLSLRGNEYLNFKNLKDPSLLMRDGPLPLPTFQKNIIGGTASTTGGFNDQNHHDLLFKLVKTDGKLIRAILENNGFSQTEGHDWNILWTCQSMKLSQYEGLNENQKINHFPQSFELTRKDRLCYNVVQMQEKFGKEEFNIIPDTYILPDEFADFYSHFHKLKSKVQSNLWIIKPQNSSQGKGIYLIDDISEVPIDESCIVSRYITNPLLINGLKFDLRIYVLITGIDPWRVYVYHEGLCRFASEPYSSQSSKQNKFAHLTNYSINKKNDKYQPNLNAEQDDTGHKWSLAAFSKYLEQIGIDLNLMWSKIYDVIIKSLLSIDSTIYQNLKKLPNKNNCFELLGYDILIDSDLKPWLMEVNLSPSLATDSPLDVKIKSNLIVDTFNLVGIKKFDRRRDNLTKMKNRVKNIMRAKSYQSRQSNAQPGVQTKIFVVNGGDEKQKKAVITAGKQEEFTSGDNDFFYRNKLLFERISQVNGRHRDMLRETLQEHIRKNNFIRIYPSKTSDVYDQYFVTPRPSNRFLHRYLFFDDIIPYPIGYPGAPNPQQQKALHDNNADQDSVFASNNTTTTHQLAQTGFPQNNNMGQISMGDFTKMTNRTSSAVMKNRLQDNNNQGSRKHLISANTSQTSQAQVQEQNQKEKLLITGDDVLIEYVSRLMIAVKSIKEHMLRPNWKTQIEKFIKHYVWHSSDVRRAENNKLWQRLESRLIEMKERRKRLLKSLYKKENPQHLTVNASSGKQASLTHTGLQDFEKEYELKEEQKNVIIQGFSAAQLEEMLRTSTKNVAYEVISCLIDQSGRGVLTEIIKWLTTCNQNLLNDTESILNQLSRKKDDRRAEESDEEESFQPTPIGIKGDNASTTSAGSASIGSSGDVRIKIRKGSMDPHSKVKANHSYFLQQKLKEKEFQNNNGQQQQELQVQDFNINGMVITTTSPHQKTNSVIINNSNRDSPKAIQKQKVQKEETKESAKSLKGSPNEPKNRSFQIDQKDDLLQKSRYSNLEEAELQLTNKQFSVGGTERRKVLDSKIISLNPCAQQTSSLLLQPSVSQNPEGPTTLETHSSKKMIGMVGQNSFIDKIAQNSNSSYFKTYQSSMKADQANGSQYANNHTLDYTQPQQRNANTSAVYGYSSSTNNVNVNSNISAGAFTSGTTIGQSQNSMKKVIKMGRKTYSSVKRDSTSESTKKNSSTKITKNVKSLHQNNNV